MNTRVLASLLQDASGNRRPLENIGFHQIRTISEGKGTANNEYIKELRMNNTSNKTVNAIENARTLRTQT